MAPKMPNKLPPGVLPEGIQPPPGTDIMQFCRDLAESGADFAEQFDRSSATFHSGNTTAVPMGGEKVPESMGGAAAADWRSLPENTTIAIEQDFGPEYAKVVNARTELERCKKAISVVNKPVEVAMKLRVQYKDADGDDKTAWESRLRGAENDRDGALTAATEMVKQMDADLVSKRTRDCVNEVSEQGRFNFEDKETFGEYMQVLQRANQAIFADQKKLLAKLKEIKKAAVAMPQTEGKAVAPGDAPATEAEPVKAVAAEAEPVKAVGGA